MMHALSPSRRRMVAIGLAVLVVMLILLAVLGPAWWLHLRYDRSLADFSDQLARHQRIAATREATEAKLTALKSRQLNRYFLKSASPSLASSELQEMVRNAIESAGARLITIQIPPHKDDGRYRQVSVNVQISSNGPALRRLLHTLESAQPYVLIENITIRQSVGSGFRPAPGTEPDLYVQFDLSAYAVTAKS